MFLMPRYTPKAVNMPDMVRIKVWERGKNCPSGLKRSHANLTLSIPVSALFFQTKHASSPQPTTMDIRVLHPSDIPHVQQTNITNLPENYFCKYYMYHALSWPQLSYVAVDVRSPVLVRQEAWLTARRPGITTEEDAIRCAKDSGLCTGEDGGRPGRRRAAWAHHITQRYADT